MSARLLLAAIVVAIGIGLGSFSLAQPQRPRDSLLGGVEVMRDIEYDRAGDKKLLLDVYLPEQELDEPLPVIVWIHGGGWQGGDKGECPALWLVEKGYAAVSISYRFTDQAHFPAQIHDCKSAIRWIRANAAKYGLDPERIGVWGSSAGGHLAALLGASGDVKELEGSGANAEQSSRVQAVCDFFGPTDFLKLRAHPEEVEPELQSVVTGLLGGPIEENKERAAQASPVTYVSKDDPPFLIMHGSDDRIVPVSQSQSLYDALKKAGVEVTLHVVEGAGHGFDGPEIRKMVEEFFDKHLKKGADDTKN
jgi:acetyl esterase/lipase